MSKYCMSCGAANPDHATVCARCKKTLTVQPPSARMQERTVLQKDNRDQNKLPQKNGMLKYVIIGVLAIIAVVVIRNQYIKMSDEKKQNDELIQIASDFMMDKGFSSFTYKSCEGDIVTFTVNETFAYADLSGEISVNAFQYTSEDGETQWNTEFTQAENCLINWKMDELTGTWQGEEEVRETFAGDFTNIHTVNITKNSDNEIGLHYERYRGYNEEIESWDGNCTLPKNCGELNGVASMHLVNETIQSQGIGTLIDGIYNIDVSIQIHFNTVEINGCNMVHQNTMHVDLNKKL